MKKLDVSAISNTNGMPVKGGIWEHMQSAYQEALSEVSKAMVGNNYSASRVYILNGCLNTGVGSTYNISAGAVFYAGEVYLVDAVNLTVSGSNVPVAQISTTYYTGTNADPVQFTDGVNRNIHEIRKMSIVAGLSGSGAADFEDLVDLKYRPQAGIGQVVFWRMPGTGPQNDLISTYFDGSGLGIHPLTLDFAIANGNNDTDDYSGYAFVGYKPLDSDFGTIGATMGAKTHTLTSSELPSGVRTGGVSTTYTEVVATGNAFKNTTACGGGSHNNIQPSRVTLPIQRIS